MKKIVLVIIYCMVLLTCFIDCRRRSSDPSPDPCAGKTMTGAGFGIVELKWNNYYYGDPLNWTQTSCDTVFQWMEIIKFVPLDTNGTSYNWQIAGVNYSSKEVEVNFSSSIRNQQTLPIKLTIQKKKTNLCFPADTGTVTYTKNMVISSTTLIDGSFRGYRTDTLGRNPSDTFTVNIATMQRFITYTYGYPDTSLSVRINNLNTGCTNSQPFDNYVWGYKQLKCNGSDCDVSCHAIIGPGNDDITIYYSYNDFLLIGQDKYFIFKGKRIK